MADTPRINGNVVSWADLSFKLNDERYYGIMEASYGHKRTRTKVYGSGSTPRGRTSGKYEVNEVSITMDVHAYAALTDALAQLSDDGETYGDVEFEGLFQYSYEADGRIFNDELTRLTITGDSNSNSESPDPIKVTVTMDCMELKRDGKRLGRSEV